MAVTMPPVDAAAIRLSSTVTVTVQSSPPAAQANAMSP